MFPVLLRVCHDTRFGSVLAEVSVLDVQKIIDFKPSIFTLFRWVENLIPLAWVALVRDEPVSDEGVVADQGSPHVWNWSDPSLAVFGFAELASTLSSDDDLTDKYKQDNRTLSLLQHPGLKNEK